MDNVKNIHNALEKKIIYLIHLSHLNIRENDLLHRICAESTCLSHWIFK